MPPRLSIASSSSSAASKPVVMLFPSGAPPASIMHNEHKDGGLKLKMLEHAKRKHQHELQAESAVMRYGGVDYGSEGNAVKAGGTLLVGVHDKKTGTVSVVPASSLFMMKPTIKAPQTSLAPPPPQANAADAAASSTAGAASVATKRDLVESLGAAKALKKQRQMAQAAVKADAVFNASSLGADIKVAADAADQAAANLGRDAADMHALHPPFDQSATTLAAAYPRSGLIPEPLWAALDYTPLKSLAKSQEERQRLLTTEASDLWPPFVLEQLGMPLPSNKSARHERMKLLAYLTHLLRFQTLRTPIKPRKRAPGVGSGGEAAANDDHPDAKKLRLPRASWDRLMAEYTEPAWSRDGVPPPSAGGDDGDEEGDGVAKPEVRRITPMMRDKVALHALAIGLHLGESRLRLSALASSLGLTEERIGFFLKQLGCKIQKDSSGKAGVLQLPLVFPKISRGAPQQR